MQIHELRNVKRDLHNFHNKLLTTRGQGTYYCGLYHTWRYPVSCVKNRLQYSTCSACVKNQYADYSSHYPYEYTQRETNTNGWLEPLRCGSNRIQSNGNNLYYPPANRLAEEKKKEGAILCFGRGIIKN